MKRIILAAILAIAATLAALVAGTASASVPAGTWDLYPAQTDTAGTPTTDYIYETAVRPPINADGSSVFQSKRGVIPVQFDLLAGTVTTTHHTVGPVVFESIWSNTDAADNYSYLTFAPDATTTLNDIKSLVANYTFTEGDCYGGSLRWTIWLAGGKEIHVYYGVPNGPDQGCTIGGANGSGENLMDDSTAVTNDRFEFQSAGAPVYTTYAAMQALTNGGTDQVLGVGLILDSGWHNAPDGDQRVTLGDVSVNGNTFVPKTNYDDTTEPTDLVKTCDLPQASIVVNKTTVGEEDAVNEANSVQPKDTGEFFRNVDCKYIYNLDVSTLFGVGDYSVAAKINGVTLDDPALFGLK